MAKLFANSGDPDQTPHSAASDLGLHCLPSTLLWVSQLQWVKWNLEQRILKIKHYYEVQGDFLRLPHATFFFFFWSLNFYFVISHYKTPSGIRIISKGSPVLSYFVILPIYSYVHHTHIPHAHAT